MSDPQIRDVAVDLVDRFEVDRPFGRVIGSATPSGGRRLGVDREGVLGIRAGALRIRPLLRPGWARASLAYGPFKRRNGLGLAVHIQNGHHGSEPYRLAGLRDQLSAWVRASRTDSLLTRLRRWPFGWRREGVVRRLATWLYHWIGPPPAPLEANCIVGWQAAPAPPDPLAAGALFAVRPAGPRNGELLIGTWPNQRSAARDLQNVPLHLVVLLREAGAAYYLASLPGVPNAASFPSMRPLAIDHDDRSDPIYAGLQQSVLGEIGFSVDTVVYGVAIAQLEAIATWYGTAQLADRLHGSGALEGSAAECGGTWHCPDGDFRRSPEGVRARAPTNVAILFGPQPSGLIRLVVDVGTAGEVSVVWRARDLANHWRLSFGPEGCSLVVRSSDHTRLIQRVERLHLKADAANVIQITDDGLNVVADLNGQSIFADGIVDRTHSDERGVGFASSGANPATLRDFEAHAREIPVPAALHLPAITCAQGEVIVLDERFVRPRADLHGLESPGGLVWSRLLGDGTFGVVGSGELKVRASVAEPLTTRTGYGVPWLDPTFADVATIIVPPGDARDQDERSRAGVLLWQDARNYVIVNTWLSDDYGGASISCFFYLNGFEDVYDAVWTNVGDRVYWGQPFELRVCCDGDRITASVDGEPVLQRAVSEVYYGFAGLKLHQVGLVANWEWGHDTGSRFRQFVARRRNK